MKTADLIGAELDYWVAKAEGHEAMIVGTRCLVQARADGFRFAAEGSGMGMVFEPSTRGDHGVPILERAGIATGRFEHETPPEERWRAEIVDGAIYFASVGFFHAGPTLLVAAMRCYVDSVFGEEVAP